VFLLITSLKSYSQTTIHYSYDAAGNRTESIIYLEKDDSKGSENLKDAKKKVEEVIDDDSFKPQILRIYPNPTKGLLRIEILTEPGDNINIRVRVLDINGRLVFDKKNLSPMTDIDLSSQPDGAYILAIEQGSIISKWKVIKQ
jgi:YD repeat-containing protein